LMLLGHVACGASGWAAEPPVAHSSGLTYTHWQDLPAGPLHSAFENRGRLFINNLNLVAEQGNRPVLIRGGGFTKAGIDWLVNDMGVRTLIDLRGRFSDDATDQVVALSPEVRASYTQAGKLDALKNLSPDKTAAYVHELSAKNHAPIQYINLKAEDPALVGYLNGASPQKPLAMFCQWGINRSGTGWGVYAAQHGWPLEKAIAAFGVPKADGSIRNVKDIEYGYRVEQNRLKKKTG
jgi:hypothetical protein